ncbi:MAG TPA: insulinase family protein, partial [Sulfurovum sp.]|nr:insulinase family protein [Sulfurovum sp.]
MAKLLNITIDGVSVPLIFEQDNRLPLVSMQLVFQNAGALTDTKAGLAKLSSKLLGEGTKEQGSIAFATALENRAISLGASVGAESFVVTLGSLKSEFDLGVASLRKLLDDPNYSDEAFSKIQSQTIGALTQKQSDFDFVASN